MASSRSYTNFARVIAAHLHPVYSRRTLSCGDIKTKGTLLANKQISNSVRFSSSKRESIKVNVNGVSFHCEKTGHGPHTVVLLPGALGSSKTDFDPQLEKMNKDKFTIYSFDPRGYGKSFPPERDWPLEYLQRDAEDAVAVMKKQTDTKFSVLGWSDGGITGLILASRYPDLVRKLVIWGCNSYISEQDMKMIRAVENVEQWSQRMRAPFIEVYGEEYFRTLWKEFVNAYSRYFNERNGDICSKGLKNITCPTFIIHGDKDPMVDPVHPDYLHKHIVNSRLLRMPDGKHNIHLRYAEEFNKMVEDFLEE